METTHAEAEWFTVARDVNVPPALLVDLVVATFVYTVDGRGCDCASLGDCRQLKLREEGTTRSHRTRPPKPPKGLGWNGTHWAVMNWALRVTGEDRSKETAEETANINAALALCAPLQRRLSQALSILPKIRRIVFRGIGVAVGTKYKLNTVVQFSAFTSTSAQGSAAMAFMNRDASGTFFIIRTLEATPIEQFSFYPEQREALLDTDSAFRVDFKYSKTLLQLLGCKFDIVQMTQQLRGAIEEPPEAKVAALVDIQPRLRFIFDQFLAMYVEAALMMAPPRRHQDSSDGLKLFKVLDMFVSATDKKCLFLVGEGGAGKTSATVACLAKLGGQRAPNGKMLFPMFAPLPQVSDLMEPGAIDRHLAATYKLDPTDLNVLRKRAVPVVFLDSLDEIHYTSSDRITDLIARNPWTASVKCVVSCRGEFLNVVAPAAVSRQDKRRSEEEERVERFARVIDNQHPEATLVTFVLPFATADTFTLMKGVAMREVEAITRAKTEDWLRILTEQGGLSDKDTRNPCIARIATEVVSASGQLNEQTQLYGVYAAFLRHAVGNVWNK